MFDGLSQEKTQAGLNTAHGHQLGKMGCNFWLDSKDDGPGGVSVTNFYLSKRSLTKDTSLPYGGTMAMIRLMDFTGQLLARPHCQKQYRFSNISDDHG